MVDDEIRQLFLNFFQDRGHKIIPGASMVPHGDPTLLLTTAGMVQIKPYFLGLEKPPCLRLTSCQKCFRTTDVDSVGDTKHLTFFEMLGNFSVGDYFKKEAIPWAWEFVTRYLNLPEERLWITIYLDDDEAFACWRQAGVAADRILRFGDEDNFWGPAGDSGPCGPCSEIHYDLGEEAGCGRPECKPNCDCGRFSEIWNLVFTQYNQSTDGSRTPLPRANIDTGMGLERVAAVMQGKTSVYDAASFPPIIRKLCRLAGRDYGKSEGDDRAIRIVAEHGRGIPFLIADGVLPSNEGSGYVLRRVLRRASLFGRRLGLDKPFLDEIAGVVVEGMGSSYPELVANRKLISIVITAEEERFIATLDIGLNLVEGFIEDALEQGKEQLAGEQVFKLYDTYGFPCELTAEVAREKGLSIDREGFQAEMEKQRGRARAARTTTSTGVNPAGQVDKTGIASTQFVGYETTSAHAKVLGLRVKGQTVETATHGIEVDIILDRTPFYGEMGGQAGDTGVIEAQGGKVAITDTVREPPEVVIHRGKVIDGSISVGDEAAAEVDVARRLDIARNHTATHLLQAALREVLGSYVSQKGSLVEPAGLRFDFSQLTAISKEQLVAVQGKVNEAIRRNLPVKTGVVSYKEAVAGGAIALFEEKYGEQVRVVKIGEPALSQELCGGTHVNATGEIGFAIIVSESSIGTGLRRIEMVTGSGAEALVEKRFSILENVAEEAGTSPEEAGSKVTALVAELEKECKRSLSLERELARKIADSLVGQANKVKGVTVLSAKVPPLTMPVLREMGDILRGRLESAIVVLATVYEGKPNFLAMVTPDLVARGFHAGEIVKQVATVAGGSGGGRATMAQAGGRDASRVDEALSVVAGLI